VTTVVDARTGAESTLARVLANLLENSKTGTLKCTARDGRKKYIYFKRGTVELLKTNRSKTLLGKALLKRRKLSDRQLQAALERQKAASKPLRLGEILIGMGIVLESDVHQALAYQIAEEIFELFTWPEIKSEFFRGEPPLDIFESEDLQARVSLSPVQLTREARRRHRELQEIQRTIDSTHDVYAPTPSAYKKDDGSNPVLTEVLASLDGQRTVEELLDVARAPDLVALRTLVRMNQDGDAVALSAQELLALGQELEDRGEFERARLRYVRAEELGSPDFDLPRRIGQIAEALQDVPEACRRYAAYADRCDQAGYPDVAAQTLARVLELDGNQHVARERYAELLAKTARALKDAADPQAAEKAEEAAAQYEIVLARQEDPEDQRRVLSQLVELLPERHDLRERMVQLALDVGDGGQAIEELHELATAALEAGDDAKAVKTLERILEIEPGEILALQSLAATRAKMGDVEEAVRAYLTFAQTFQDSGLAVASAETLVDIYERVIELDPDNAEARRFLATAYDEKEEADKAITLYTGMVESLRKSGPEEELLDALDKLSELKPLDMDLALERARLAKKLGRQVAQIEVFRQVAESAALQGDVEKARSAWSELLGQSPGDLDAHLALARLESQQKEHGQAAARCASVFEMALMAGSLDLAEEAVKRALDYDPDHAHRERLARIYVARERTEEAVRELLRAARGARDDEDFGLARTRARRALELDPENDDARDLLENVRRALTQGAGAGAGTEPVWRGGAAGEPAADSGRPKIAATITGGPQVASIEGLKTKTKKISGTLDKLRALKGGGPPPGEDGGGSGEQRVSKGPEAPGDSSTKVVSKKASKALSKLKALRSGGGGGGSGEQEVGKGPEADGGAASGEVSKKATNALSRLKALRSGGGGAAAGTGSGEEKASKGPEAAGDAAPQEVSKKATNALSRLKALRSGGGGGGDADVGSGAKKVAKAPGAAADGEVSKKATNALGRLKALRSGGGGGGGGGESGGGSGEKVSKGPEAPGDAAPQQVSKKATSAMSRLKALKGDGAAQEG